MKKRIGILIIFLCSLFIVGCNSREDMYLPPFVAKEILRSREINRDAIAEATFKCVSSANRNRDVKYNDTNEVTKTCINFAERLYNAYSKYDTDFIIKQANKAQ